MNKLLTLILMLASIESLATAGMSARDIMLKNEDIRKLKDIKANATLVTGGTGTTERKKTFTWWRKLKDDHVRYNTLTRFHTPAEIKSEGILFLEKENDESDVMLYLPSFKKVRRVERQSQSGSFMGSELSYADIATPHVDDFEFSLLKETTCPTSKSGQCYVIESKPKRKETEERTGYMRSTQWIRKDNFMSERIEHFGPDGNLAKTIEASNIKIVEPTEKKWMAHKLDVKNVKNQKFTLLEFTDVQVNRGIPDNTFTQQNLSNP